MKNKILVVCALACACILSGCQSGPKNEYLKNLDVSYSLTANDKKVNQEDFEFYYGYAFHDYLNTMETQLHENAGSLLPFEINDDINSLADQKCTLDGFEDQTWEYYFAVQAKDKYQEIESLYAKAIAENYKADEAITDKAEESYQLIVDYCKNNNIKEEDYLHSLFGVHATKESMIKQYEKLEIVTKYCESFYKDIDKKMIEEYYHEHSDEIDIVDIRYFAFVKDETGKKNAEDFQKNVKTEADFKTQVLKYAKDEQKKYYQENDLSLRKNLRKADLPEYLQEPVFDKDIKVNQVLVVEGESSYDVVMFVKRQKPTYHQVNISTIYLDARESDEDELTDEKVDKCHKFAKELLQKFKDEKKPTLDIFHEYNEDFSDNKTNQGDFDGLSKGDSSPAIEKWIFDSRRKTGDTAVLPSTYGYTIVYYRGLGEVEYLVRSEEALMKHLYQTNIDRIKSEMKVELK